MRYGLQWFDAIDKDKNGQLTALELQNALQLGGLDFSLATVAHIIRIHDRDGKGAITLEEFGKLHEFLANVQTRWAGGHGNDACTHAGARA